MGAHWLVEDLGDGAAQRLHAAVKATGGTSTTWDDSWWGDEQLPRHIQSPVVFHGSLGNAARIRARSLWWPGAYCDVDGLRYSRWAAQLPADLVNQRWTVTTVRELVAGPERVAAELGAPERLFVRPDSPLKPFAGRVLEVKEITLDALDHGFYYEDLDLPVVAAPAVDVGAEWRFVVVDERVVAASGYEPDGRHASADQVPGDVSRAAAGFAAIITAADPVYVLDLANINGRVRVVELNPFSGADLYNCDRRCIVETVEKHLSSTR